MEVQGGVLEIFSRFRPHKCEEEKAAEQLEVTQERGSSSQDPPKGRATQHVPGSSSKDVAKVTANVVVDVSTEFPPPPPPPSMPLPPLPPPSTPHPETLKDIVKKIMDESLAFRACSLCSFCVRKLCTEFVFFGVVLW